MLASCSNNNSGTISVEDGIEKVNALEAKIYSDSAFVLDRDLAVEAVSAYIEFAEAYPEHENTPDYYFKAGEISMNMMLASQAIMYFNKVENQYNTYEKAPYSIFLQAFIYETQLNNLEKAKEYYQKYIDKYPDHEFAKDAKLSIENLGVPLDELIRKFEENNSQPADSSAELSV